MSPVLAVAAEIPPRPSPIRADLVPDEPLSVALTDEAFAWFASGDKIWELRRCGRQFNANEVVAGRAIAFRRGFRSDGAIHGAVEEVVGAANVASFFDSVSYQQVIPVAESVEEAIAIANRLLGPGAPAPVIGFRVEIERQASTDAESQVKPTAQDKPAQPARPRRKPAR